MLTKLIDLINRLENKYSYGHGLEFKNETEKKDRQLSYLKMENEILKKYMEKVEELKKE